MKKAYYILQCTPRAATMRALGTWAIGRLYDAYKAPSSTCSAITCTWLGKMWELRSKLGEQLRARRGRRRTTYPPALALWFRRRPQ